MKKIQLDFGFVVPVGETKDVSVSILEILPKRKIPRHFHKKTKEIEIIIEGEPIVNGERKRKSEVLIWEPGEENTHEYYNDGDSVVRIVCIAIPKYDPSDSYECK